MNWLKKHVGDGGRTSKRDPEPETRGRNRGSMAAGDTIDEGDEMPSSAEIDRMLEDMLEEQKMKPAVRDNIRMLPDDKKWMMLQGFRSKATDVDPPDDWVTKIHVEPTSQNLETLSVILRTQPVSWVQDFLVADGT